MGDVEQMMSMIGEKIREYGWMVTGVFPHAEDNALGVTVASYSYTIGLTTAGLPELIMSGPFDARTTGGFLNSAATAHIAEEIKPGDTLDYLANVPFRAIAAKPGTHVQQALNYYRDPGNRLGKVRLLQIIWPDRDGHFPDEPGWTGGSTSQKLFT